MVIERWRQWRARRTSEAEAKARQIQERTWAIFREIADPLVAEGLGRLSWPMAAPGPWKGAEPAQCVALEPVQAGAAAVWACPVEAAWIDLAVGDPFPEGWVYELEVYDEGWEAELRSCLQAVIEGRYIDRTYQDRGSAVHEMVFDLASAPKSVSRFCWDDDEAAEPEERRYLAYRG